MKKALVIDDNRVAADILCHFLTLLDFEATPAYGAHSAIQAAINAAKAGAPDIIFMDLNMPGLNGFEVLGYLRREPELMEIPVVFVTSDDQPETAERACAEGALAVLVKPVSVESLEEMIKKANL